MTVVFNIPSQAHSKTLFEEVGRKFGDFSRLPSEVIIDFRSLRFCRPTSVVFISNLTHYLIRSNIEVKWRGLEISNDSIRFLDDSLFFEQHLGRKLSLASCPRNTTRPLQRIAHTHSHAWIDSDLVPWIARCSDLPIEAFPEFRTCVSELFNNIVDHTDLDVGSTFAQWYPNEKRLQIAIADFGCGIPSAVRSVLPSITDQEAIVKAFEEGFSSRSTPRNRGAGLFYLRQIVTDHLGGSIRVSSGAGSVEFTKSGNSLTHQLYTARGYCPGTMVEFEIRTDQISADELGEVDFEW